MSLLIEGAVAQRFTSKNLSTAGWTATRVTVTDGQANDPTGAATLSKVADTSAAGVLSHTLVQSPSFTAGEVVSCEVMAKAAEYGFLQIAFGGTAFGGTTKRAFFNLAAGALGTIATGVVGDIKPVSGGAYRCIATASPSVTGAGTVTVTPAPTDNTATYEHVTGSGIYAGNALLTTGEIGSWAPDGRAADHLRCPLGAASSPGQGSITLAAMLPSLPFGGLRRGLWVDDDGSANNRLYLYVDSAGTLYVGQTAASVAATPVAIGVVAPGAQFAVAGGWDGSSSAWSLNGLPVVAGPAGPAGLTTRRIGHAVYDLTQPLMGEIGVAQFSARRMGAAVLMAQASLG